MSVYARTLRYFRPYWLGSVVAAILAILAIGLNLLKPWPFKYIVDGLLDTGNSANTASAKAFLQSIFGDASPTVQVIGLSLTMVVIILLWGVVNLFSNYLFLRIGLKALLRLRTELYSCLQALPLKYHDSRRSSDSAFRVAYDTQSIQTIYNKGFAGVFSSVIMLVGALVIMFSIDWKLTLASLAILPFVVWAIRFYAEKIRRESTSIQEKESDLLSIAQEGISSIRIVHAFGREGFEIRQFRKRASRSLEANLRLNVTSVMSTLVIGTLIAIGTAVMYCVGSLQNLNGSLTLGDLIVFTTYLGMLYQPLEQLSYTAWALEGAAAGSQRCFEVLDSQNDVPETPGATKLTSVKGEIEFRQVEFSYDGNRPILQGLNLKVEPGQTVALVGGTGAGKSTLLSLVPRFYDPTAGEVFLDGHNLRNLTKKSLRSQISLVLQDTLLFSTTIRENIAYGRPGATFEEIVQAAKRAQAYDFISSLPDGFDSMVGERGSHLSVGQRQRIGIARAFLKDSPILLLDEPTSALDPSTEHSIMEAIAELMKGRTTLIVTHRLATIHSLSRIVLLKNGRLAEDGTGPELLAKGGLYAELYRAGHYEA